MPVAGGATFQGSGGSIDNSNLVTSFKGKMKLVSSVTSSYNQTIRIIRQKYINIGNCIIHKYFNLQDKKQGSGDGSIPDPPKTVMVAVDGASGKKIKRPGGGKQQKSVPTSNMVSIMITSNLHYDCITHYYKGYIQMIN